MCWPHVFRNINPYILKLKKINENLATELIRDIEDLQNLVTNEHNFRKAYGLLEQEYISKSSDIGFTEFFQYFREQWVDSPVFRWWEGSHPWGISNNQGIEGLNKHIKESHTFKRRCPLGYFFDIVDRMVTEFSLKDDTNLITSRLCYIEEGSKDALKLKTEGYQWAKINQVGTNKILSINVGNKYTISDSEEFNLGKVDRIWAVDSSENKIQMNLIQRAKNRISQRKSLDVNSFKEYKDMRTSCWLLEERDNDFFCDCPIGMKGKLCKHTIGMRYVTGKLEATSQVRSVPLGQKRKRGRPKRLPNCLIRSPVRSVPCESINVEVNDNFVESLYADPVQSNKENEETEQATQCIDTNVETEINEYERIRQQNIREKEAMFNQLGLEVDKAACRESDLTKSKKVNINKRKRKHAEVEDSNYTRQLRPRK